MILTRVTFYNKIFIYHIYDIILYETSTIMETICFVFPVINAREAS